MGKLQVTDFLIYRWRYPIGYTLFFIAVVAFLVIAGLFIPGGLSKNEINSALISDSLSPTMLLSLQPNELLFLPYHALQAISISLLGFNGFAIKLPSILLAALSAAGLLALMSLWFRRNIAVIGSIIAVSMGQFMLVAQSGHPDIAYIFWAVCVLLTASLIVSDSKLRSLWIVIGFVLAGLGLYMPLNIYVVLALLLTAIFHPHARHIIMRETSKLPLIIGSVLFIIVILPLVLGVLHGGHILLELLGIPASWSSIPGNAWQFLRRYSSFYNPQNGLLMQPIYNLGTLLLILLGMYRMFTTKYTTKSYLISFWLLFLLPFMFLNPSSISITFIPAALLLTQGVEYLIRSWYQLFPRNPYARVFGLLPLAVLVVGISVSNIDRYAYGFHYSKAAYSDYTYDLEILGKKLKSLPSNQQVTLLTSSREYPIYSAFARHQHAILVLKVTSLPAEALHQPYVLATRAAKNSNETVPSGVIAWKMSQNADRFYLYKKS